MVEYAQHEHHPRAVGDRRRPARAGGRPRPADPRPAGRRRARRPAPDERAGRPDRPARSCGRASRSSASRCTPRPGPPRSWARTAVPGLWLRRRPQIECDMVVVAAGIRPNVGPGRHQRIHRRAGDRRRRPDAHHRRRRRLRGRRVRAAPRRGLRPGRAAVGAGRGAGRPHHRHEPGRAAYHGSRTATKLKVAGVDVASMGVQGPERDTDEHVQFSEPKHGIYKTIIIRDGKLIGATLVGDVSKVAFLMQAFDRGPAAAGGADRADVRPRHPGGRGRRRRAGRRRAGLQLQRGQQGRPCRLRRREARRRSPA